jgi:hypothetical protein
MLSLRIARLRAQPCRQGKAEEKFCLRHINTPLSDIMNPRTTHFLTFFAGLSSWMPLV